jgi:ubiquinol-cytochrome c reductase cytochrome c subunit
MSHIHKLSTLVLALIVLASLTPSVAFAQDPDNGKVLWEEQVWQCQRCHGPAGEGLWAGPRAGDEKTAQEWIDQVRNPRERMPRFSSEKVSDEQIIDMHAYLTSLPKPDSFTPADAGLPADAPEGQQLIVEKKCVACHNTTGPIKGFIERGEIPTVMAVIEQLRMPRKFMPSFSTEQVSDAEAALIAEFMASQVTSQISPGTLPESGSAHPAILPIVVLLIGGALLLAGLMLRRLTARA